MSLELTPERALLADVATVEDAEPLLQWLQEHPAGTVNLADCTHLHTACLQALLASGAGIEAMPVEPTLAAWLAATNLSQRKTQ